MSLLVAEDSVSVVPAKGRNFILTLSSWVPFLPLPLLQVLGAAAYNGVELEVVETQAMKGDTKKPEYLALFPYGKIPAFKGTDGFSLIEGKAIARYGMYLINASLHGHTALPCHRPLFSRRSQLRAAAPVRCCRHTQPFK